jgi:hypothetical protein
MTQIEINSKNVGRIAELIVTNELESRGFRVSDLNKEGTSANPKTVPILVKRLIKQLPQNGKETAPKKVSISAQTSITTGKRPPQRVKDGPVR